MIVKRPRLAVRMGAALAVISFVLANGLSASGLHAALHAPSQVPSLVAHARAEVDRAHHAVEPSGPDTHEHDTSDDCACLGTCASATPQAAPSGDEVLLPRGGVERQGATHVVTTRLLGQLKAYLFPLPNAPPIPA